MINRTPRRRLRHKAPRWLPVGLLAGALGIAGMGLTLQRNVADAVPVEGHTGWSVLLCKYSDSTAEPRTKQFYREMFTETGRGLEGLADYYADQSRGRIDLRGSTVQGWYTMTRNLADAKKQNRGQRIDDCIKAASDGGYTVPRGNRTIAVVNEQVDAGASGGRVLLDPGAMNIRFASHELLHGYDLGHSFSNDLTYQNASWSQPGEYDDEWDQMSAQHVFSFATARFGQAGVGLNGYHRDRLGWLPRNQVLTFGADGVGSRTITVNALEAANAGGTQLVRIPFDPADLNHYYTVEFRQKTGWSRGIPASTVLLHEIKGGIASVLRNKDAAKSPTQSINANGVTVSVTSTGTSSATVRITSNIVDRCKQGYVWREARSSDHVCVTGATRTQARNDNAAAASRWVNGAYGPHTCIQGYVWREAFSGDDVCVTPAIRTQTRADNAAASSRNNPARDAVWGPNACASGNVWREVDNSDYVCVPGAVRTQARNDNAAAASRWVSGAYGPHTCISGYVWREAFPADDVCVTPTIRTQTAEENRTARDRVANRNA